MGAIVRKFMPRLEFTVLFDVARERRRKVLRFRMALRWWRP